MEAEFSFFALFWRASFIVQLVMLILMIASFWAWTIIITKHLSYRMARTESDAFDKAFWSGEPLDELYETIGEAPAGASEKKDAW